MLDELPMIAGFVLMASFSNRLHVCVKSAYTYKSDNWLNMMHLKKHEKSIAVKKIFTINWFYKFVLFRSLFECNSQINICRQSSCVFFSKYLLKLRPSPALYQYFSRWLGGEEAGAGSKVGSVVGLNWFEQQLGHRKVAWFRVSCTGLLLILSLPHTLFSSLKFVLPAEWVFQAQVFEKWYGVLQACFSEVQSRFFVTGNWHM